MLNESLSLTWKKSICHLTVFPLVCKTSPSCLVNLKKPQKNQTCFKYLIWITIKEEPSTCDVAMFHHLDYGPLQWFGFGCGCLQLEAVQTSREGTYWHTAFTLPVCSGLPKAYTVHKQLYFVFLEFFNLFELRKLLSIHVNKKPPHCQ